MKKISIIKPGPKARLPVPMVFNKVIKSKKDKARGLRFNKYMVEQWESEYR